MDDLISRLMENGQGSTGPPPASTDLMDSLPRYKADKPLVEGDKECTICKDGFNLGEDVTNLPCSHVLYAHPSWNLTPVIKIAFYHGSKSMALVQFVDTPSAQKTQNLKAYHHPVHEHQLHPDKEIRGVHHVNEMAHKLGHLVISSILAERGGVQVEVAGVLEAGVAQGIDRGRGIVGGLTLFLLRRIWINVIIADTVRKHFFLLH
jgi:hypothetical protein